MFCYKCGSQVNESLKYCNSCGEKLKKGRGEKSKSILDDLTTTLFLVVMFGLGIMVGLVAVLLDKPFPVELLTVIIVAYLAVVFGICLVLLSQIKKVVDAELKDGNTANVVPVEPVIRLSAPKTAELDEYREPASVTDSTTRTLDEALIERK